MWLPMPLQWCGRQRTTFGSQFFPSILWVPGIELRPSGLLASIFTQLASSLVQFSFLTWSLRFLEIFWCKLVFLKSIIPLNYILTLWFQLKICSHHNFVHSENLWFQLSVGPVLIIHQNKVLGELTLWLNLSVKWWFEYTKRLPSRRDESFRICHF